MRKLTSHPNVRAEPVVLTRWIALAYWYPVDGDFTAQNTVRIVAGGADALSRRRLDRNVAGSQWFPDGQHLLICAADGTQNRLWIADLSGATQPLILGPLHRGLRSVLEQHLRRRNRRIDRSRRDDRDRRNECDERARTLPAAARVERDRGNSRTLTIFCAGITPGAMQEITWDGPDGFHEDGVVTYPPAIARRAEAPGRAADSRRSRAFQPRDFVWERWPLAQMIASRGYVVLQPNYRGSDNLGNKYMTAIVHDTVVGTQRRHYRRPDRARTARPELTFRAWPFRAGPTAAS